MVLILSLIHISFRAAYHGGIEGLEIDIRMTQDGVIVIHHDETLERLTCGSDHPCTRAVRDCTWAELEALELPYACLLYTSQVLGIQQPQLIVCVAHKAELTDKCQCAAFLSRAQDEVIVLRGIAAAVLEDKASPILTLSLIHI